MIFIDETGNKYGKLTVLHRALYAGTGDQSHARWDCICECGNTHQVTGIVLRRGTSKSCGCTSHDHNRLPEGEAAFNNLCWLYKKYAKKANREFKLSKEQFRELTKSKCHYCGKEPGQVKKFSRVGNGVYIYNGIDRLDSSKGYTPGNVVSCCWICNIAKHDLGYDEFLQHIQRIYDYRITKKRGQQPGILWQHKQ